MRRSTKRCFPIDHLQLGQVEQIADVIDALGGALPSHLVVMRHGPISRTGSRRLVGLMLGKAPVRPSRNLTNKISYGGATAGFFVM